MSLPTPPGRSTVQSYIETGYSGGSPNACPARARVSLVDLSADADTPLQRAHQSPYGAPAASVDVARVSPSDALKGVRAMAERSDKLMHCSQMFWRVDWLQGLLFTVSLVSWLGLAVSALANCSPNPASAQRPAVHLRSYRANGTTEEDQTWR